MSKAVPQIVNTIPVPDATASHDLVKVLELLLHEIRTPASVAHGYLRLLAEDRISDDRDRQRALSQSMDAVARIGNLCTSAGEYLDAASPSDMVRYPATALVEALQLECRGKAFAVTVEDSPIFGDVRSLTPARAATAVAAVLGAALRSDPALTQAIHVGVRGRDLLLTTGDEAVRERLVASIGRAAFNQWRGGTGLAVPVAMRLLAHTDVRIWTLPEESGAVAMAIPLEPHA